MWALRARWLFPIVAPPIADGVLTIDGATIVAVGENLSGKPPVDLGRVAVLPGLVNAHAHLDFSNLTQPLGKSCQALPEWIRCVVDWRLTPGSMDGALQRGLQESLAAGVALIGNIGQPADVLPAEPRPALVHFREMIALSPERCATVLQDAEQELQQAKHGNQSIVRALSPHAPYTVSNELLEGAVHLSRQFRAPLAMHLGESREELELLANRSGPFRDLLVERGVWHPDSLVGRRPLEVLEALSNAPRTLVIHGNYLDADEIEFLAERPHMSVVFCPRTHRYFGHDRYPLAAMLNAGVRVALGTDGRGSNPDLRLWSDLCEVAATYPEVSPADVLRLGTINGAEALGLPNRFGALMPGMSASLAVAPLTRETANVPHELLFEHDSQARAAYFEGQAIDCPSS